MNTLSHPTPFKLLTAIQQRERPSPGCATAYIGLCTAPRCLTQPTNQRQTLPHAWTIKSQPVYIASITSNPDGEMGGLPSSDLADDTEDTEDLEFCLCVLRVPVQIDGCDT